MIHQGECYDLSKIEVYLINLLCCTLVLWNFAGKLGQRNVAVKIQRPDAVKMAAFLDEAQILKTLDHPNILKLLAVCSAKEPVFLVTEFLVNGRLSLYLRGGQGSELKLSQLVWICAQVSSFP